MINVVVCGATGKVGTGLVTAIEETEGMRVTGAVASSSSPAFGQVINKDTVITSDLGALDDPNQLIVDFSVPQATIRHLRIAEEKNVPFIVGTTGFSEEDEEEIRRIAQKIPVLMSHNFGIGMNIFYKLVSNAAKLLSNYDIEIVEYHGRDKKDAPSGTGHTIARYIAKTRGLELEDNIIYGRKKGLSEDVRDKNTIGMHSLRGGSYKSKHTVIFAGDGDTIEMIHREESLQVIIKGVISSIEFINNKKPGLYDMNHVLGIN
jgi:4-hydroxy-tetrahydrodipicolinate reductase